MINAFKAFLRNGQNKKWCFKNFLSDRNLKSALRVRQQLKRIMLKNGLPIISMPENSPLYSTVIRKAFLSGYFTQVAHLQKSGNYMVVRDNQVVAIHPSSNYDGRPDFVLYHTFILTSRNFIRNVRMLITLRYPLLNLNGC